jgi:signal recognition particle receptor subunit beta
VNEFIWPNDILCDVNCILSKCFQVQLWGCPGKPKFQFHILCGWRTLYILSYITVFT